MPYRGNPFGIVYCHIKCYPAIIQFRNNVIFFPGNNVKKYNFTLVKKYWLFVLVAVICFASCKKENMCDCYKSTGKIISEQRTTEVFSSIYLSDNVNLFLLQDSTYSIRVEAGKNLLPLIKTRVEDGALYISNNNKCNWIRSFKPQVNVYIKMPGLFFLQYSGCGDITMENTFVGDSIWINSKNGSGAVTLDLKTRICYLIINTGPCDVTCKGSTDELQLYHNGHGMVHCENFPTFYTYVTNKNTGNCYLNVRDLLLYNILWSGNIYYTGNPPQVSGKNSGSGNIIPF